MMKVKAKEGSEVINDLAESGLIKAIKDGNITAIFYRLNHIVIQIILIKDCICLTQIKNN